MTFLCTCITITAQQAEEWANPALTGREAFVTTSGVFVPGYGGGGVHVAAGRHTARAILVDIFPALAEEAA